MAMSRIISAVGTAVRATGAALESTGRTLEVAPYVEHCKSECIFTRFNIRTSDYNVRTLA